MTRKATGPDNSQAANFLEKYRVKIAVAFLLTFAAGLVDIVGYLGIFRLFTAHMTGTTVQLARNAAGGNWVGVWSAAAVVTSFFIGSAFGRVLIQVGSRVRLRRIASVTLLLEAVLLFGTAYWAVDRRLALASAMQRDLLLSVLAASMGLQTATLTGVGPLTIHTTFVTGMLNKLAQFVSRIAFRTYDFLRLGSIDGETSLAQKNDKQQALFVVLIWSLFLSGALAGSWLYRPWGVRTLYLAVVVLLAVIAIDQIHPLSIEEEKEQSESPYSV
jgi:uncharacterized membrane protein YoaK (UPF0700 family)